MILETLYRRLLIVILVILLQNLTFAADTKVEGYIKDAQTGEPLFGANIVLMGTALGAASNMYGKYEILKVPAGPYKLKVSYIGYSENMVDILVKEGNTLEQNFSLEPESIEGETVLVTAQAIGQKAAINQQLTAKNIINVVSSARIQELPDANAAESVGRLPGISLLRSGGEGNKLVVRGLQPKFNAIMLNGVRMSATDPNDRSIDLSMISPYMLDGIEVTKSITPDLDADVLGGTVNFKMRTAGGNEQNEELKINFQAQGGYNNLSNAYNKYNNYKYVASIEKRFFEGRFGVFAQGDFERRNLTSNELGTTYNHLQNSQTEYVVNDLTLYNIPRDRKRGTATVVMDYKLDNGRISFVNFYNSGTTTTQNRNEVIDLLTNSHNYHFGYSKSNSSVINNSLNFEYDFSDFKLDAKISHASSEVENPDDFTISFLQRSAIDDITPFVNQPNLDPRDVNRATNNNVSQTFLDDVVTNSSLFKENSYSASVDIEVPLNLSKDLSSVIKFGGKYRYQKRSAEYELYDGQGLSLASARFVDDLLTSHFESTQQYMGVTTIPITAFADPGYDYGEFLGGDYHMNHPLSFAMMSGIANVLKSNADYIYDNNAAIAYGKNNFESTSNNYSGNENLGAFYSMATLNFGENLTLIGGVRYQELRTEYTGVRGIESPISYYEYASYDTTVTNKFAYWLPSVVLKYKPLEWFDVRAGYSNTISYPDYTSIIPRIDVASSSIAWNNYKLTPSKSSNYDIYLSFYNNQVGLFTIGGFYKQITDLIYSTYFYASKGEVLNYFPPSLIGPNTNPTGSYKIFTFVNDPYKIDLYGLELDWQTHFWYLPQPFDGLVLNINYTHTYSEAQYPYTDKKGGWVTTYVDTSFTDRLLYQPNDIVNLSLGYDYSDFSIRISMLYQADIFAGVNYWEQLRTTTAAYTRWDLTVKQKLPWYGVQLYCSLNNINSQKDKNVLQMYKDIPQSIQSYGMTATLGMKWTL